MDITQIPEIILGKLENWLTSFISTLPNLVVAILILAAGIFLAKFISKGIQKLLRKFLDNEAMIRLSGKLAVVAMILGAGFLALGVLNLDKTVTSLLAGAGIAGLAISLAFKDAAMNLIAGVYIAVRKPFEPGSHIDTNDWEGIVKHISLRSTQIRTFQGQIVTLPNRLIFENPINNYSASEERRVDLEVGVGYESDLDAVEAITIQALESCPCVDTEKPVQVHFHKFGDSSIQFTARFWAKDAQKGTYLDTRSKGLKAIKKAYDQHHINIPFPIRTLQWRKPKDQSMRVSLNPEMFESLQN